MEWDRKMRGKGKTNVGATKGSPVSPIIFLIWMALIIKKIEIEIQEVALYDNELPSCLNDLHVNIYIRNRIHIDMELLLKRINKVVNWVARDNHLPLGELKYEKLVLRKKRREKNNDMKWVK